MAISFDELFRQVKEVEVSKTDLEVITKLSESLNRLHDKLDLLVNRPLDEKSGEYPLLLEQKQTYEGMITLLNKLNSGEFSDNDAEKLQELIDTEHRLVETLNKVTRNADPDHRQMLKDNGFMTKHAKEQGSQLREAQESQKNPLQRLNEAGSGKFTEDAVHKAIQPLGSIVKNLKEEGMLSTTFQYAKSAFKSAESEKVEDKEQEKKPETLADRVEKVLKKQSGGVLTAEQKKYIDSLRTPLERAERELKETKEHVKEEKVGKKLEGIQSELKDIKNAVVVDKQDKDKEEKEVYVSRSENPVEGVDVAAIDPITEADKAEEKDDKEVIIEKEKKEYKEATQGVDNKGILGGLANIVAAITPLRGMLGGLTKFLRISPVGGVGRGGGGGIFGKPFGGKMVKGLGKGLMYYMIADATLQLLSGNNTGDRFDGDLEDYKDWEADPNLPTVSKSKNMKQKFSRGMDYRGPSLDEEDATVSERQVNVFSEVSVPEVEKLGFDVPTYLSALADSESSNQYDAVNKSTGALGKYQFMADALSDFGLIKRKPKGVDNKEWVENRENWLDGWNKEKFLNTKEGQLEQEKLIQKYMLQQNATLERQKSINGVNMNIYDMGERYGISRAGIMKASHLQGVGNVSKLLMLRTKVDLGEATDEDKDMLAALEEKLKTFGGTSFDKYAYDPRMDIATALSDIKKVYNPLLGDTGDTKLKRENDTQVAAIVKAAISGKPKEEQAFILQGIQTSFPLAFAEVEGVERPQMKPGMTEDEKAQVVEGTRKWGLNKYGVKYGTNLINQVVSEIVKNEGLEGVVPQLTSVDGDGLKEDGSKAEGRYSKGISVGRSTVRQLDNGDLQYSASAIAESMDLSDQALQRDLSNYAKSNGIVNVDPKMIAMKIAYDKAKGGDLSSVPADLISRVEDLMKSQSESFKSSYSMFYQAPFSTLGNPQAEVNYSGGENVNHVIDWDFDKKDIKEDDPTKFVRPEVKPLETPMPDLRYSTEENKIVPLTSLETKKGVDKSPERFIRIQEREKRKEERRKATLERQGLAVVETMDGTPSKDAVQTTGVIEANLRNSLPSAYESSYEEGERVSGPVTEAIDMALANRVRVEKPVKAAVTPPVLPQTEEDKKALPNPEGPKNKEESRDVVNNSIKTIYMARDYNSKGILEDNLR